MREVKNLVLIMTALVIVSGCVSVPAYRKPLDLSANTKVNSARLLVNSEQKELLPEAKFVPADYNTGYTNTFANNQLAAGASPAAVVAGSGLGAVLGVMIVEGIENHQIKNAEKDMVPIKNELYSFQMLPYFKEQLIDQFDKVNSVKIKDVAIDNGTVSTPTAIRHMTYTLPEDAIVVVTTNYQLSNNFTALVVNADVRLYGKDPRDLYGESTIYQNMFTYINYLPKNIQNRQQAVSLWSQDNGQYIKTALKQAANSLSQWIATDIANPSSDLYANMKNNQTIHFTGDYHQPQKAKLIGTENDLYVVRDPDDTLSIVNMNALTN